MCVHLTWDDNEDEEEEHRWWREWIGIALVTSHEDNLLLPVGWAAYLCLQHMFTHHSYTAWFYLFLNYGPRTCGNVAVIFKNMWIVAKTVIGVHFYKKAQQLQFFTHLAVGYWKPYVEPSPRIFVKSLVYPSETSKVDFQVDLKWDGETFYLKWWIHMSYPGHKFESWCSWSIQSYVIIIYIFLLGDFNHNLSLNPLVKVS